MKADLLKDELTKKQPLKTPKLGELPILDEKKRQKKSKKPPTLIDSDKRVVFVGSNGIF